MTTASAPPLPEVPAAGRVPDALEAPLRQFLFEPEGWCRPRALGAQQLSPESPQATRPGWRRAVASVVPPRGLDAALLCRNLRGRLALLPRADWLRLGLCVCVLPSCGQIQRSLDGHFRRAVQQLLDDEGVQGLDRVAEQLPGDRPVFLAGPGAWRHPDHLAAGGVRAAMEQACRWTDPVRLRVRLRFEPEELQGPPSVGGIDITWLEIACKALWPHHPWLWS